MFIERGTLQHEKSLDGDEFLRSWFLKETDGEQSELEFSSLVLEARNASGIKSSIK